MAAIIPGCQQKPVLNWKEQKELERFRAEDQREIKRVMQEPKNNEKSLGKAAEVLIAAKIIRPSGERTGATDLAQQPPRGSADLGRALLMVPGPANWLDCWAWASARCMPGAGSSSLVTVMSSTAAKGATCTLLTT